MFPESMVSRFPCEKNFKNLSNYAVTCSSILNLRTIRAVRDYSHRARELPLAAMLEKEYVDFNCTIHTK